MTENQLGIILHHLEDSRSQRILWLLEELETPYTIKEYKRLPTKLAPPELLAVHPLGKSPVITDGPFTVAESGAIVGKLQYIVSKASRSLNLLEYLITRYGKQKFGIADELSPAWVENLYYTHASEGSLQPPLVRRVTYRIVPSRVPFFIGPVAKGLFKKIDSLVLAPDLEKFGKLIEARLTDVESKGGWFAGTGEDRPTSADFMMSFSLQSFLRNAPEYAGPKIKAYVNKFQERPAYKRALQKGGDFAYNYTE